MKGLGDSFSDSVCNFIIRVQWGHVIKQKIVMLQGFPLSATAYIVSTPGSDSRDIVPTSTAYFRYLILLAPIIVHLTAFAYYIS